MKKTLLMGVVLCFSILIITPSLSAIEFTVVKNTYEDLYYNEYKELNFNKISESFKHYLSKKSSEADDPLYLLVLLILYLIVNIVFKGIPNLINDIVVLLVTAINYLIIAIKGLLTISFDIIVFLINTIFQIILIIWHGIGTFIGLILDILRLIYEAIFPRLIQT